MIRHLALFLLATTTPLVAAPPGRNYTVTSFDRIRVEGPYAVSLAVGRAPMARAEGSAAATDAIDLRVDGRTLIIRQRSGSPASATNTPVRISVATPDLRSAMLVGAGSLAIDRLKGLSVEVAVQGSGALSVAAIDADKVNAGVSGSGALSLAGKAKSVALVAQGTPIVRAEELRTPELTVTAAGVAEVMAHAGQRATVAGAGNVRIMLNGNPTCTLRVSGSAAVSGCGKVEGRR